MRLQGRAFSLSLGSTAVVVDESGEERLLPEMTRHLMRVLLADTGVRARVFAPSGELLADSFLLTGSGGIVQVVELPPPSDDSLFNELTTTYDQIVDWIPGMEDLPRYQEAAIQLAEDYPEVGAALAGDSQGTSGPTPGAGWCSRWRCRCSATARFWARSCCPRAATT